MRQGIPINPSVLKWARESAGYTIEEEVSKFPNLIKWECGELDPSYSKLEELALRYKRPVAIFFFPTPPKEKQIEKSFRALSESDAENLSPRIRFLFRKAKAFQINLQELYDNQYVTQKNKLSWLKNYSTSPISESAVKIRDELKIDIAQQKNLKNEDEALEYWRDLLAKNGIYIFKDAFNNDKISGFCIYDDIFPIIYLNNSVSKTRQIFTIFHELGHLLLNQNYLDIYNDNYWNPEKQFEHNSEWNCDLFAANFLVPDYDLNNELGTTHINDEIIKNLSIRYKVSKEVILRKLLHKNIVTKKYFFGKLKEWKDSFLKHNKNNSSGGSYYYSQFAYLGKPYSKLVFEKYYQGKINKTEAAGYLNINVTRFDKKEKKLVKTFDNMEHLFALKGAV